jgi:hypothetical protein
MGKKDKEKEQKKRKEEEEQEQQEQDESGTSPVGKVCRRSAPPVYPKNLVAFDF